MSATPIAFAGLRPIPIAHEAFDLVGCPGNRLIDIFRLAACGVRSSSPSSLPDTSALRSQSGPARRTDFEPRHGQGYCAQVTELPRQQRGVLPLDSRRRDHWAQQFRHRARCRMPAPPIQRRDTGARCSAERQPVSTPRACREDVLLPRRGSWRCRLLARSPLRPIEGILDLGSEPMVSNSQLNKLIVWGSHWPSAAQAARNCAAFSFPLISHVFGFSPGRRRPTGIRTAPDSAMLKTSLPKKSRIIVCSKSSNVLANSSWSSRVRYRGVSFLRVSLISRLNASMVYVNSLYSSRVYVR
jgi:hypothetical protein